MKQIQVCVLLISVFIVLGCTVFCTNASANQHQFSDINKEEEFLLKSHFIETDGKWDNHSPVLLWWTSILFAGRKTESVEKIKCKSGDCLTTLNRNYLSSPRTQGILFYGTDISPEDLPLPRRPWHEWALFHEESPLNNYKLCHQPFLRLFNHTATCRRESDFPLTLQWIPKNDYLTSRQPLPTKIKNQLKQEKGLAPVLYIQSHCEVPSDRDRYVKALMDYIPIDSFGKCLNNKQIEKEFEKPEENWNNPNFLKFISQYKFHIAFENAFLKDYMTEKLMRTYHVGSVPIYKGAPTAKDWMPSDTSIIFVDDFESPETLANFIKYLDQNDDEYDAFLKYKKDGVTNSLLLNSLYNREWRVNEAGYPSMRESFECHVCDEINKRSNSGQKKAIKMANGSHYGCQQPYTLLLNPDDLSSNDSWRQIDWIDMYWRAFDESLAVIDMIQAKETDSSKFHKYLKKIYRKRLNS